MHGYRKGVSNMRCGRQDDHLEASLGQEIEPLDGYSEEVVGGNFNYNVLVLLTRISQALDPEGRTKDTTPPTTWEWRKRNEQKNNQRVNERHIL